MFRAGVRRSPNGAFRPSTALRPSATSRATFTSSQLGSKLRLLNARRPQALAIAPYKPWATSVTRYASTKDIPDSQKTEEQFAKEKLEPHPSQVSTTSTTIPVVESGEEREVDMMAGVKADLRTIRETFALTEVPREAYNIGMAGVLPYLATSATTVYLAWDINHADMTGQGFLLSGKNAELLLNIVEPLQVGYGAVIISFLGAIHWGLEWAGYGGYQRYKRYMIGVIAPAVAWPTIVLPVEYALIAQFLAFNFLYFTDARATVRGWCPPWYNSYRFVLTFVVGASIVLSLIGRGQIADKVNRMPGPADRIRALKAAQWESLEEEEEERQRRMAEEEESDDEE